jgi:hypothetical protein
MDDNDFWFWAVIVGAFILFVLYLLFTFKNAQADALAIKEGKVERNEAFQKMYDDEGIFTYREGGFDVKLKDETISAQWDDIETIFAYKIDLMTYDMLAMEIKLKNDFSFRITEEAEGWYQFIKKIKEVFPSVKQDFEMDLMFPAFATNLMVVYDAEGRPIDKLVEPYRE